MPEQYLVVAVNTSGLLSAQRRSRPVERGGLAAVRILRLTLARLWSADADHT